MPSSSASIAVTRSGATGTGSTQASAPSAVRRNQKRVSRSHRSPSQTSTSWSPADRSIVTSAVLGRLRW